MIHSIFYNKIVARGILGFFVALFFLLPITSTFSVAEAANRANPGDAKAEVVETEDSFIWNSIGNAILSVAAYIAGLGGVLLNWTFTELVLKMGNVVGSSAIGTNINALWTTIRDVCNLVFIFGFIYIGISTILGLANHDTKRMLAQIIIGALLINFSLAITKVVIEFSNFTSVEIYEEMVGDSLKAGGTSLNISDAFAQVIGITSLYNVNADHLKAVTGGGGFWFYFGGAIFFIVLGFVLAMGGILILLRFIGLIFIMIFSPILFAATVFPKTAEFASGLWHKLFSYSFFAPVYLILILIALQMLNGFKTYMNVTGTNLSTGLTNPTSSFGIVGIFVIAILFLIFALHAAQSMGVAGSKVVVSFGKKAIGKTTAGLTAATMRATVGRGMYAASESNWLRDKASQGGIRGWAYRKTLGGTTKLADSAYDVRNVGDVGNKLGIGAGSSGGYKTKLKETEAKETKVAKSLGEIHDDDPILAGYKQEAEKAEKEIKQLNKEKSKLGSGDSDKAERARIADEIEKAEKLHKENTESYKLEKQRRITGSAAFNKEFKPVKDAKEKLEKEIRDLDNRIGDETDMTVLKTLEKERDVKRDEMKAVKGRYKKLIKSADAGYAGVLEASGPIDSWFASRLIVHDREAGIAIRKAYTKKAKLSKDDEKHKELIDASKKPSGDDHH